MAEMTDPPAIKKPVVARKNTLFKGYAAFNDGKREILDDLFCDTFTDAEGNTFPAWHKMSNAGTVTGKDKVLDYLLDELRTQGGAEAELLGVSSDGNVSITVDFTYNGPEGDHACADKIVFDDSGRIKEVWHCKADSHDD